MKENRKILPESCYELQDMSLEDVKRAHQNHETVVGFVESISKLKPELYVRLGKDLIALLPFDEATIYPYTYSQNNPELHLPLQINYLNEKKICAKVKRFEGGRIILSRKENMLEAYESIKDSNILPFMVTATKIKLVFGDVGGGILGKINISDLCKTRINSTKEICRKNEFFSVKVINFDELKRANVSLKDAYPDYNPSNYVPGELIQGVVNNFVDENHTGVFINISHQVNGILDIEPWHPVLNYGDVVECLVKKAAPNGLRLRFVRIIN